jgi:hypothetical protein
MIAAMAGYGWPVSITLNADVSTAMRWLAGIFSIGVSLTMFLVVVRVYATKQPQPDAIPHPAAGSLSSGNI